MESPSKNLPDSSSGQSHFFSPPPIGLRIKAVAILRRRRAIQLAHDLGVPTARVTNIYNGILEVSMRWLRTGIGDPLRTVPRQPAKGIYPDPMEEAREMDQLLARLSDRIRRAAKGGT